MRGAVERDGADLPEIQTVFAQFFQGCAHSGVPVGGVLLGPARMREFRHVFRAGFALQDPVLGNGRDFTAAGAEIDSQENGIGSHHFTQAWTGSLLEISPRLTAPAIVHR